MTIVILAILIALLPPPIPLSVWGTVVDAENEPYEALVGRTLEGLCDGSVAKTTTLFLAEDQVFYAIDMTCAPGAVVTFRVGSTVALQPAPLVWSEGASIGNFTLKFVSANAVTLRDFTARWFW